MRVGTSSDGEMVSTVIVADRSICLLRQRTWAPLTRQSKNLPCACLNPVFSWDCRARQGTQRERERERIRQTCRERGGKREGDRERVRERERDRESYSHCISFLCFSVCVSALTQTALPLIDDAPDRQELPSSGESVEALTEESACYWECCY